MVRHDPQASYWHQQSLDQPLYPDLLWSRPERRSASGKLLIIGGNSSGLSAPAEAFQESQKAGIGEVRVVLPDALKRIVGKTFSAGQFAPSTPSGSFNRQALAEFLTLSRWSDGTLIAGDLGRNSETAILLEQFIIKYSGQLTATDDTVDYLINLPTVTLNRPATTLIINLAQLQKLAIKAAFTTAFTSGMDLLRLIEALHQLTVTYPLNIVVKHLGQIVVASNGEISTTKLKVDRDDWQVKTSTDAAVWWLQNKLQTFAALTSAIYAMGQA